MKEKQYNEPRTMYICRRTNCDAENYVKQATGKKIQNYNLPNFNIFTKHRTGSGTGTNPKTPYRIRVTINHISV